MQKHTEIIILTGHVFQDSSIGTNLKLTGFENALLGPLDADRVHHVVVDIGCGRGRALLWREMLSLRRSIHSVSIGVDISPEMIACSRRLLQKVTTKNNSRPRIAFGCVDARHLQSFEGCHTVFMILGRGNRGGGETDYGRGELIRKILQVAPWRSYIAVVQTQTLCKSTPRKLLLIFRTCP
jgi:SAM-dependent methyltransferase